jgi:hypothetical protein
VAGVPGFEPGQTVLETAVLPLTPYPCKKKLLCFFVRLVRSAGIAEFFELQTIWSLLFIFGRLVITIFAFLTNQRNVISCHNSSTNMFRVNKMKRRSLI